MKREIIKTLILVTVFAITGFSPNHASLSEAAKGKPRNIILFIGDGMGVTQLQAGMSVSKTPLSIEKFPYSGLLKTHSANNYITDSGAGGTAIASGFKTNNGMIGVTPDGKAVPSIMEYARKNGYATGVVSTSAITHATPASFVAHNTGRGNYEDIAKDFLNGTVDLFIGGGQDHFMMRKDSVDLTLQLKEMGYSVVFSLDELKATSSSKIAGLLAREHMETASAGRAGALEQITAKAIETLSRNKKGFVLMVEGSMIDWAGHDNNLMEVVSEMLDLDNAVEVARKFAETDGNTLVIVTSDHETGGLTLTGGNMATNTISGNFSVEDHTAVMVPIFSLGPDAHKFSGIRDNTFFLNEFLDFLNIKKKK